MLFITFTPASATWPSIASVPITNAVMPRRVSASRCCDRPADGHDVGERGLDPEAPELADVVLAGAARVVRREGHALPGGAQPLDRLDGAVDRLVADPDAAVEVDDQLVVALDEGGEGHVRIVRRTPR